MSIYISSENKQYIFIYKTTNLVSNKFYIGVHKTSNLDDGYLGSGNHLRNAIKKYGIENFSRCILEYFDTLEEAYNREREIVNEKFVERSDTYNIREGGNGGFYHINIEKDPRFRKNLVAYREKLKDPEFRQRLVERNSIIGNQYNFKNNSKLQKRASEKGIAALKGMKERDPEKHLRMRLKQSVAASARKGSRHVYINPITKEKKRIKKGHQPNMWITTTEYKETTKSRATGNYGSHWYNDGTTNYLLKPDNLKYVPLELKLGRIGRLFS